MIQPDFTQKLKRAAYLKDPFEVAQRVLLGAYLCTRQRGVLTVGKITEVEVYIGAYDKGCHAYPNRKTPRNQVMFGTGGHAYIYFVYGMYEMFNVVVGKTGEANAILIRSLEPVLGIERMKARRGGKTLKSLADGPGKLCQALGITRALYGTDLTQSDKIWISPKTEEPAGFLAAKRIGIDYAQEYKDKLWRFLLEGNPFVSKKPA
ncbi:MAG: DNA-3-methyladenine glycosylase [Alphaproteobacteria bacterium]|nr:DNA-3-methyladenine glycosylase [Alphaproteobacteria bacterium]